MSLVTHLTQRKSKPSSASFNEGCRRGRAINGGTTQAQKKAWTRLFGPRHRSTRQLVERSSPSCQDQSPHCTKSRLRNSRRDSIVFLLWLYEGSNGTIAGAHAAIAWQSK